MKVDYKKYKLFNYEQNPSKNDKFELGEVVIKDSEDVVEIGVIIQCHGNNEYRTDQFGNCCYDSKYGDIKKASILDVLMNRPSLLIRESNLFI